MSSNMKTRLTDNDVELFLSMKLQKCYCHNDDDVCIDLLIFLSILTFSGVAAPLCHKRGTELVLENSALLSCDLMSSITMWL